MKNSIKQLSLNGDWELRQEDISCDASQFKRINRLRKGWLFTPVPGDIHQGLIAAGQIKEPLVGLNSFDCKWVENYSWWLRRTFTATRIMLDAEAVELVIGGLDANASVFLNDAYLGEHPSTFRPFIRRIEDHIHEGKNTVLVRLTHGLENISKKQIARLGGMIPTEAINGYPERGDRRRVFVRKPQYCWGWDWSPRLATVGITGDAEIRVLRGAVIRDVNVKPMRRGKSVELTITVRAEWLDCFRSGRGCVSVRVTDPKGKFSAQAEVEVFLQTGLNYIDIPVTIPKAKLWWPSNMGPQNLYEVAVTVKTNSATIDRRQFKYGIRFVELDTKETFALRINGTTVFCKGANWIPADALYARVTDEKIEQLVAEAKQANFNMFRVWGGGLYEREAFYEICDREGIMIWQDFMFACGPYPDHLASFRSDLAKEADFQTKRLRNHACVVMW